MPDQIALPEFLSGAMENWGLVTYRERYLMWDRIKSSITDKQSVAAVIAHEMVHQVRYASSLCQTVSSNESVKNLFLS